MIWNTFRLSVGNQNHYARSLLELKYLCFVGHLMENLHPGTIFRLIFENFLVA